MNPRKVFYSFLSLILVSNYPAFSQEQTSTLLPPPNLRCEYRENPLGIDLPNPRLSWELQSEQRGQKQTAYRILVAGSRDKLDKGIGDVWDSGKVVSAQTSHISYQGTPLQSDQVYHWKVQVWDKEDIVSDWSAPAFWSTGLLKESDWQAKWIGLDKAVREDNPKAEHRRLSARMLRHEFQIDKKVARATAFVCGLGLFEFYINGKKIGDQVLAPALSEYGKRAYYMTFDVTKDLLLTRNAVGVILGNGRYFAPRNAKSTRDFGYPKLLLQINIHYQDGTFAQVISDESWKLTADGPIRANNEYDGEVYDARKEMPDWAKVGFDDSAWQKANLVDKASPVLAAQPIEPIKITQTIQPVAISEPQSGVFVIDMGQNMVGWVRLKVKGPRGTKVTMRFAETLKSDGTLFMDNIRGAEVTDVYILRGDGVEVWEPRFTYHGFRYVEMKGYPGKPDLAAIEGRVVHDALPQAGTFTCSNPLINKIYQNAVWGIRGNYRSIPTDCPQRDERQGWLGDRSAESRGESFLFDVANFYNKWLVDIQDAQSPNGSIPDVAPSYWPIYSDNTTWPGSYLIISAMLYEQYGDLRTIERHYPSMKKWMEHMSQYVQDGIMQKDTYGDWCVPPKDLRLIHTTDHKQTTSAELIGTAYFHYELKLMEKFATLLNKPAEAAEFGAQAEQMKKAFNDKFLDKNSLQYSNNSQTSNILALRFGLVPDEYRSRIFDNLVEKIMGEAEGHVGTGLIGCQWLMRTLSDNGRPDIAYALAAQTTYPSWGYMVEHGATTIWELWNGDTGDAAMNSHNHVMLLGDLLTWFYEYLAGIQSDPLRPAWEHLVMKPLVEGELDFVKASYHSLRGKITSEWSIVGKKFSWNFSIPANTTATIYVPADDEKAVTESGQIASKSPGVRFVRRENGRAIYEIESGSYAFTSASFARKSYAPFVATPVISPNDTTMNVGEEIIVKMKCKTPGAVIHYTLDGSEPDESALVYRSPVTVTKNLIINAKAFKQSYHPSVKSSANYDFVDPHRNGVEWALYEGAFTKLPDFSKLQPSKSGRASGFDLASLDLPKENFALMFTGYVQIDEEGEYGFSTVSNDGSQLFIDDRLVVDSDGEHGPMEKSGRIRLTAGRHAIKVTYFQSGGSKVLRVYYQKQGKGQQPLPGSRLCLQ